MRRSQARRLRTVSEARGKPRRWEGLPLVSAAGGVQEAEAENSPLGSHYNNRILLPQSPAVRKVPPDLLGRRISHVIQSFSHSSYLGGYLSLFTVH